MPHRSIVIVVALIFAIGIPLYYVVIRKRASSSLEDLLGERFTPRACPVVGAIEVPSGGRVTCTEAYDDREGAGVLVLGYWDRGTIRVNTGASTVQNRVAGLFKPAADAAWIDRARGRGDVIVATAVPGGAVVVWKGLPSRASVVAGLEAVR